MLEFSISLGAEYPGVYCASFIAHFYVHMFTK